MLQDVKGKRAKSASTIHNMLARVTIQMRPLNMTLAVCTLIIRLCVRILLHILF